MIFQESDQDDDCSHSILISEEGDPSGDGQDWQPRTEGIHLLSLMCLQRQYWLFGFSPWFQSCSVQSFEISDKHRGKEILAFGPYLNQWVLATYSVSPLLYPTLAQPAVLISFLFCLVAPLPSLLFSQNLPAATGICSLPFMCAC